MKNLKAPLVAGYALVLTVFSLAWLDKEPFDDSYFFKRMALNLLDHGMLAWNVADGPVYGSTSQLFQLVMVAVTALTRSYAFLAARALSVVCLVGCFALLLRLTRARDGGFSAVLACAAPIALYTVLTGMETALALMLIALFLFLLLDQRGRAAHWSAAPLVVVLIWLTRPDAVLLVVPLLTVERWARSGRPPIREGLLTVALVGGSLAVFAHYYGTALPLPFYAKQRLFSPYDAHFLAVSAPLSRVRIANFLFVALPLALAASARRDRVNLVLIGSALAFALYHYVSTVEVMGMIGRFYAPAVPILVVAAARGIEAHGEERGLDRRRLAIVLACLAVLGALSALILSHAGIERARAGHYVCIGSAALVLVSAAQSRPLFQLGPSLVLLATLVISAVSIGGLSLRSDDAYLSMHTQKFKVYRGLDTLRSCFGDGIDVYHSEVGVPGLRFIHGTVTDLAGLLSPAWLFRAQSFDALCANDRPEAIFLPHKNYRKLNAEIAEGACIRGYERMVDESSSPLFVRRDLVAAYTACRAQETP
jgi:hypothetical protein